MRRRSSFAALVMGTALLWLPAFSQEVPIRAPALLPHPASGSQSGSTINSVENAASGRSVLAQNTWITIFGDNLSLSTRAWQSSDFVNGALPTRLDGVGVMVNGRPAYVSYVSPTQINALTPVDSATGTIEVQTSTDVKMSNSVSVTLVSAPLSITKTTLSPAFFVLPANQVIATHLDGSLVGPPNLLPDAATTPAQPGETISLYGTGFGETSPPMPNGLLVNSPRNLMVQPVVLIGGIEATVLFAGLVQPGLYQFDVIVPARIPRGAAMAVQAQISGYATPIAFLRVAQ